MDWFRANFLGDADPSDLRASPLNAEDLSRAAARVRGHGRVRPAPRRGRGLRGPADRRRRALRAAAVPQPAARVRQPHRRVPRGPRRDAAGGWRAAHGIWPGASPDPAVSRGRSRPGAGEPEVDARSFREPHPGQVPTRAVERGQRGRVAGPAPRRVRPDRHQPAGSRAHGRLGGRTRPRHRGARGVGLGDEGDPVGGPRAAGRSPRRAGAGAGAGARARAGTRARAGGRGGQDAVVPAHVREAAEPVPATSRRPSGRRARAGPGRATPTTVIDPARATAVLEDTLDHLGSAHHRPFSREG